MVGAERKITFYGWCGGGYKPPRCITQREQHDQHQFFNKFRRPRTSEGRGVIRVAKISSFILPFLSSGRATNKIVNATAKEPRKGTSNDEAPLPPSSLISKRFHLLIRWPNGARSPPIIRIYLSTPIPPRTTLLPAARVPNNKYFNDDDN